MGTASSVHDYALLPGSYPHQQGNPTTQVTTPSWLVAAHFVAVTMVAHWVLCQFHFNIGYSPWLPWLLWFGLTYWYANMSQIACYLINTKVILITILGCDIELYATNVGNLIPFLSSNLLVLFWYAKQCHCCREKGISNRPRLDSSWQCLREQGQDFSGTINVHS